jgi:hypothetical protein
VRRPGVMTHSAGKRLGHARSLHSRPNRRHATERKAAIGSADLCL